MKYFFNTNPKHKSHNLQALNFLNNSSFKIGIMGGSFNPAHEGHLAISLQALKKYKFDYIIWLVAKQNPFKPIYEKNIFRRAEAAKQFVKFHPQIIISTVEQDLQETQTYYVLKYLIEKFKTTKFIWIMGVDNISHFKKWDRSNEIRKLCNILVFDRPCKQRMVNLLTLYNNEEKFGSKHISYSMRVIRNKLLDISSTYLRTQNNDNQ